MNPGGAGSGAVLVIGATGLLGSHTADRLEAIGRQVIRTSREGHEADLGCDLTRPESVGAALESASPGAIVNAAGISSAARAWRDPGEAFGINTRGTLHLLDAMRETVRASHLVVASSGSVYGVSKTGRGGMKTGAFTEGDPARPASPYAASKAAAEVLCSQYSREHGMAITQARIFNQLGPGQTPGQAPSEFAREIALAEARGDPRVVLEVGNPGAERDYTDVRDTARALSSLVEQGTTGVFNVCSGRAVSLASVIESLAALTPVNVEVAVEPARAHPVDPAAVTGSNCKLAAATGWKPETTVVESLRDLLEDWRRRI